MPNKKKQPLTVDEIENAIELLTTFEQKMILSAIRQMLVNKKDQAEKQLTEIGDIE